MPEGDKPVLNEDFDLLYPDAETEALYRLKRQLENLAGSGLLFGKVECLRLRWEEEVVQEWWTEDRAEIDKLAVAKRWTPYRWVPGEVLR